MAMNIHESASKMLDFKRQQLAEVASGEAMGLRWYDGEGRVVDETFLPPNIFPNMQTEHMLAVEAAQRKGHPTDEPLILIPHTIDRTEASERLAQLDLAMADLAMTHF